MPFEQEEYSPVSLATLKNGAAIELFDEELRKVLENIADINTSPTAKREVLLKVSFKPLSDQREDISVDIAVNAKLQPIKPTATTIYPSGLGMAVERNPRQPRFQFANQPTEEEVS
jgi:hypothetical protein